MTDPIPQLQSSKAAMDDMRDPEVASAMRAEEAQHQPSSAGSDEATLEQRQDMQRRAGTPHLPTQLTYEARLAVNKEGPRGYDWGDKPHRIVYDLCSEIERINAIAQEAVGCGGPHIRENDAKRLRQLEHGKKRPAQNNPDGYPDDDAPQPGSIAYPPREWVSPIKTVGDLVNNLLTQFQRFFSHMVGLFIKC